MDPFAHGFRAYFAARAERRTARAREEEGSNFYIFLTLFDFEPEVQKSEDWNPNLLNPDR